MGRRHPRRFPLVPFRCHCEWLWLLHRWTCSSCWCQMKPQSASVLVFIQWSTHLLLIDLLTYCQCLFLFLSQKVKMPNGTVHFHSARGSKWLSCHLNALFLGGWRGRRQRDSRQLHKVKGGCSGSALWIDGNIQRSGVAPPPSALLNGDIQIYKWPWWRNRPWKIISSFIINERNSSRALCPLQTQFSNEKCCAPPRPLSPFPIHLSSAHPSCALWNSFIQVLVSRSGSQDRDANWLHYFQNQRMRRRAFYFRGQTRRPCQFPHSAP